MKLLITGSCGFIFSNFIRKSIYENAYHIASIDKIQYKVLNSLYLNKNHTFYLTDILDASNLDMIFSIEKPDIVIHASAYTLYNNSLSNSIEYTKNIKSSL
jgi:dTDP-D-glucose 4,6-dehydratase